MDHREWLETDGLGGYAMGTAARIRTRRYHGLLVCATRPPGGRMVLVNDVEVFAETATNRISLSSHHYRGDVVYPGGAERIALFHHRPWPTWHFDADDAGRIQLELLMFSGRSQVLLRWSRATGTGPLRLLVRPLLSGRDHHALHHENPSINMHSEVEGKSVCWRLYPGIPAITALSNGIYRPSADWYRHFVYSEEAARGLDAEEDLASPGEFEFDLEGSAAVLSFCAHRFEREPPAAMCGRVSRAQRQRRDRYSSALHRAADAYLVRRNGGMSVIAGYPWFTDWGRDTFIALRGLCLVTGRIAEAGQMLAAWADSLSQGMIPNRFLESGQEAEYNSVDASLWYVIAADAYLKADPSCPPETRSRLQSTILAIVAGYERGTRHGIRADEDDLLACGAPGQQLTWMDAKVGDWVVTPRRGKPVEVQALWINAVTIASEIDSHWRGVLGRARSSFARRFWNAERGMLYDVIDCEHRKGEVDGSFRPNQIFAVGGLPHALIDGPRARAVVDAVERDLWTPAGLRSLAPSEPGYIPRYQGGVLERDGAYHQGTVWPWLAGAFIEAWVRVRGDSAAVRAVARRELLSPLLARLDEHGLGHLSEIADAEAPHTGRGCPFQAWSVAEALRAQHFLRHEP